MPSKKRKSRPKSRFPKRRRGGSRDFDGKIVRGPFRLTSDGHARIRPEAEPDLDEVFIARENDGGASDGDFVTARLTVGRRGKLKAWVIAKRASREHRVVGLLERGESSWLVYPEPAGPPLLISKRDLGGASDRDAVVAEITGVTDRGAERARVVERLGSIDDPKVQVELVVRASGWPLGFEDEVLAEAARFDEVDDELERELEQNPTRRDLRALPHVTIDGADARDFDDAVSATPEKDGYRVWVSIADVSHYVRPGSGLDKSARARSTSVYFPDRVLPMLPERLSNDLCSLRPDRARFAMTCEMRIDGLGRVDDVGVYPSVIRSAGRLTYEQVQRAYDEQDGVTDERGDGSADAGPAERHRDLLLRLREAARIFRRQRRSRGALELELPESKVNLDSNGVAVGIARRARNEAHRVIEDLMIGANEAVARRTEEHDWPALYRVHEAPNPDRLAAAAQWSARFGIALDVDEVDEPQNLAAFVDAASELPAADVIHMLTLRSMAQARYSPENLGHYGLASDAYLHFTSPIRRYPDLFVHRALKAAAARQRIAVDLDDLGAHCSAQERSAMDAERTVVRLMECQVAQRFIGSTSEVVVTGVHHVGAFVRADRPLVEGLVPVRAIGNALGEYMELDEAAMAFVAPRSGRRLAVGDRFVARLAGVQLSRRHIDFEPVDLDGDDGAEPVKTPRKKQSAQRPRKEKSGTTRRPKTPSRRRPSR